MSQKTVFRTKKDKSNPYVILNKDFLDNPELSWKAKGVLAYFLSKPKDDWHVMITDLINKSTDSKETIDKAIKELIITGYII